MGRGSQVVGVRQNQLASEPVANSKVNQKFALRFENIEIISKSTSPIRLSLSPICLKRRALGSTFYSSRAKSNKEY